MLWSNFVKLMRRAYAYGPAKSAQFVLQQLRGGAFLRLVVPLSLGLLALPVFLFATPILWLLRVRFVMNPVFPHSYSRIGHLASEADSYVKEGILGLRPAFRSVLLCPRDGVANACLLDYWRRYFFVISSPFWSRFLMPLQWIPCLRHATDSYVSALNVAARAYKIQAAYGDGPAVLQLTPKHRARGEACLRALGIPEGAWYVCVHCREGGYDGHAPEHAARNSSIERYFPAMREIVRRGGWCVRMGDPTMQPLPSMEGVVDYARHELRSDWMDVFLCGSCRFFLGGASGLTNVACVFGVPSTIVNQALAIMCLPLGYRDLLIPKLLWSTSLRRHLTFAEIAGSPLAHARFSWCYSLQDLVAQENTEEEIRDVAIEMLDEIAGNFAETDEERGLQEEFRRLIPPGHYCEGGVSRIGRRFLCKYRELLVPSASFLGEYVDLLPLCGSRTCPCQFSPALMAASRASAPAGSKTRG